MSNNTSWFIILQRQWREQKNEEISEFEEGGMEVQNYSYILSTFKKHEEAEEYVRQLVKTIIQQDMIEIETIQNA
jgi:hypothetical protein